MSEEDCASLQQSWWNEENEEENGSKGRAFQNTRTYKLIRGEERTDWRENNVKRTTKYFVWKEEEKKIPSDNGQLLDHEALTQKKPI